MHGGGGAGREYAWQKVCMVEVACVAGRCVAGGMCVWQGGMHSGGACVVGSMYSRGCAWPAGMCGRGPAW